MHVHRARWAVAALCCLAAACQAAGAEQSAPNVATPRPVAEPVRPRLMTPAATPPALPAEALSLVASTLEVRTVGPATGPRGDTRRITRTRDRVHVRVDARREWLYVRNPTDARRVTGFLVEHDERAIVVFEESDLRNGLGIRGWLDVITVGVDYPALPQLPTTATTDVRTAHGRAFIRHDWRTADGRATTVWWNQNELLALDVVRDAQTPSRSLRVTLVSIEPTIDDAVLAPLLTRFPSYHQVDYADWLERRHER